MLVPRQVVEPELKATALMLVYPFGSVKVGVAKRGPVTTVNAFEGPGHVNRRYPRSGEAPLTRPGVLDSRFVQFEVMRAVEMGMG